MELEIEECSVNEVVHTIVQQSEQSIGKDLKIELQMHPDDELTIFADKHRIAQVINNIVSNAIKFTKKGSIAVSTKGVYDGRLVEVCVTDTGSGIPKEILPSLFTIFAAKSANEGAEHGTGFGLFISKAIVEKHGGSIIGYNNPRGATFKIWLPTGKNGLKIDYKIPGKQQLKPSISE